MRCERTAKPQYVNVPGSPASSLRQFVTKPDSGSTSIVRGPSSVVSAQATVRGVPQRRVDRHREGSLRPAFLRRLAVTGVESVKNDGYIKIGMYGDVRFKAEK